MCICSKKIGWKYKKIDPRFYKKIAYIINKKMLVKLGK